MHILLAIVPGASSTSQLTVLDSTIRRSLAVSPLYSPSVILIPVAFEGLEQRLALGRLIGPTPGDDGQLIARESRLYRHQCTRRQASRPRHR